MPALSKLFQKKLDIKNNVYAMASTDDDSAELTFYGDIVESIPKDWWGDPIDGDYVVLDDFVKDLEKLSGYKNITIRMNSYGGDCVAAFVIHNRLRDFAREGKNLTCIVDGVAMSAASIIMSACDTVKVNPASLIMIHKCWISLLGGYNTDDLSNLADQTSAYDKAIATAYARKTGMSETQILHMMADTTYMTGKEAVDKGFADELIADAEPIAIAASADGRSLFVRGHEIHLAPGMFAPDNIPTIKTENNQVTPAANSNAADNIIPQPDDSGDTTQGGSVMTKDELKAQYPDLIAEVEADAVSGQNEKIQDAVQKERKRISEIDQISSLYPADAVNEAKYGKTACTASEFALRMAKEQAKQGNNFMNQIHEDAEASGAKNVPASNADPTPSLDDAGNNQSMDKKIQEAKDFMHNVFHKEDK